MITSNFAKKFDDSINWLNIMNLIKKILSHNYLAIFYFNFKMLPFKQAIKLPFDFYYNIRFENLSGKIILAGNELKRGMIKIGGRGSEMFSRQQTILDINGLIIFNGNVELGHGSLLRVDKNAKITFGNEVRIGALTKIFCEKEIVFGDEIDFSWECQIFDTNFHYIRNLTDSSIDIKSEKIEIGSYNWFGNRVTLMKGCKTPNSLIVASNSLCNKNYRNLSEYTVIGGIPAKTIVSNKQRVFENLEDVSRFENDEKM
jgi:acetyltransferase-like isoleucine patch superfamily enzyme